MVLGACLSWGQNGATAQLSLGSAASAVTLTVNDTLRRLRVEGDVEVGAAYSYRGSGSALDLTQNDAIVRLNDTLGSDGSVIPMCCHLSVADCFESHLIVLYLISMSVCCLCVAFQ